VVFYVARRLGNTATVALGVAAAVFVLLHLSGDPVMLLVPPDAPPEVVDTTRHELGLDRPLPEQFLRYIMRVAAGDLGTSLRFNRPVAQLMAERLPRTIELTLAALLLAVLTAIPAGILSALTRGRLLDQLTMVLAVSGQALPVFWLSLLLIWLFALKLGWLPVFGHGTPAHLVLPAISLSTVVVGRLARVVRASMLEVLGQDYIRTARAKGLSEGRVIARHGLQNAAIPIVTVIGLQLAQLLGGAVVTESVFAWPGVGSLAAQAVFDRDFPVVQGVTLVTSTIFVVANLAVDLAYVALNPRIRLD
jgi:ABC-type dipeptide/oligopeptide/nickel transport system permease component